jgi:hypothetical protein
MANPVLSFSLFLSLFVGVHCAVGNLDVQVFSNGSFLISVGGEQWFRSGSVGARDLGQWWSQDEGTLEMTDHIQSTGVDNVGSFSSNQYGWKATGGASNLVFRTSISVYDEFPAVEFTIVFLDKATNTNISTYVNRTLSTNTNISTYVNRTLSTFPSFVIEEGPVERGYVTWSGNSNFHR